MQCGDGKGALSVILRVTRIGDFARDAAASEFE